LPRSVSDGVKEFPVISPTGEKVTQVSPTVIEVEKPGGKVVIKSSVNLTIKETVKSQVLKISFNNKLSFLNKRFIYIRNQ
jgi:hypothetical protein